MRIPSLTQACHHSLRVLVLALAAGYALAEDAARVDFAAGEVTVITAAGESRTLKKGDMIAGGDRIETGRGRVQLRFADGAYVALQPNTVFRVDQYLYANQPAGQQSAFFSLVKGGMRTVTGTIGKANRDNYKVKTPVATIGIRGTGYSALQTGAQLLVSVNTGLVAVLNDLGETLAGAGQNVAVTPETQPTLTTEQVHFNGESAAAGTDEHTEGGSDTEEGTEESTVADSEASSDVVVADTSYSPEINSCPDTSCDSVADIEKAIGQPIQSEQPLHLIVARNGVTAKGNYFEQGSDKLVVTVIDNSPATAASAAATTTSDIELLKAELDNGGVLSNYLSRDSVDSPWAQEIDSWNGSYLHGGTWWNGQYRFLNNTSPDTLGTGQFLQFIGGELTPVAAIDSLATQAGTIDYTLLPINGNFFAEDPNGVLQEGFLDPGSHMHVDFMTGNMGAHLTLVDFGSQGSVFVMDQSGAIQWKTFGGNSHDARFVLNLSGSTHQSCLSCSINITGFFAGPNANELGIGYNWVIPSLGTAEGTAGFMQGTVPQGLFIAYSSPLTLNHHGEYVASGSPVFHPVEDSSGLLTGDQASVVKLSRDPLSVTNAASQTVSGVTAGLHWGSWGPGNYQYDSDGSPATDTLSGDQRLNYVYGDLTSLADMATLAQASGKIQYGLAAATPATPSNSALTAGTLDPSSNFKFDFSLGTIDTHLVFNGFNGATAPQAIDGTDQLVTWFNGTTGGPATDARFTAQVGCVSACDGASLIGFFSGTQAQALGVAYNASLSGNVANGAAVFTKVP